MKTLIVITALSVLVSVNAYSAGTEVKNSNVTNQSQVKNSANLAIVAGFGKAEANQGSIVLKGAKLSNTTVVNKATIKNSANIAIGAGGSAKANQGSIKISKSLNGVNIVNDANIKNSANIAIDVMGLGSLFGLNNSSQGSIVID